MLLKVALFFIAKQPLYICVCVCVYTHHIFIDSSVSGYLGSFHFVAVVNNAAVNTGVHVLF